VVLALSHMGSWELYAQAAFQRPETRFGTFYQALRHPYLDELINHDRRKGVETFDRKNGFKAAIALLRSRGGEFPYEQKRAGKASCGTRASSK
jgi:heptosyltransferase-2